MGLFALVMIRVTRSESQKDIERYDGETQKEERTFSI